MTSRQATTSMGSKGCGAVEVVRAPELPVPHGFATRRGGVSGGGAWLDFGATSSGRERAENRVRLAACLGFAPEKLFTVTQVHGKELVSVAAIDNALEVASIEADALMTDVPGLALGILTADCVPVLFAARSGCVVAAAHAGWRGVVAGVLEATVAAFLERGVAAADLRVAIGPCVGPRSYEVSHDVAKHFSSCDGAVQWPEGRNGRPHVDLAHAARHRLAGMGVRGIAVLGLCTFEDRRFHSFRRDGAAAGRQMSVIVCN